LLRGVNERMIFYCFENKEGIYREILQRKLCERMPLLESGFENDFGDSLALKTVPFLLPQLTHRISGLDTDDPHFRRRWIKCLRWLGERIGSTAASRRTQTTQPQDREISPHAH
jgi:AcrR family transcriptional regulator